MIINGYTAEHMQEIEDATIVSGTINSSGHLMLDRKDGTQVDAGYFGLAANLITVATDFNTLTTPGTYLISSSAVVAASTNTPTSAATGFTNGQAGYLLVEGNGGAFVKQTWTNYNNGGETIIRTKYNTTWYSWTTPVELASATQSGLVELATNTEVQAGTDTVRAVTPAGLASLAGYRYSQLLVWSSSGTFTKASYPGLKAIRVRVVGGGGGGGGANAATASNHSTAGGGGGGGYAEALILAASLGTSESITVGAGGVGGSGTLGSTGGTSSFGTKVVATGGTGGNITTNTALYLSAPGGDGGTGTSGDIKASGSGGELGTGYATLANGGSGGSSPLGGGATAAYTTASASVAGSDGGLYGGGGSGSSSNQNSINTNAAQPGGSGGKGVVIVEVFI